MAFVALAFGLDRSTLLAPNFHPVARWRPGSRPRSLPRLFRPARILAGIVSRHRLDVDAESTLVPIGGFKRYALLAATKSSN